MQSIMLGDVEVVRVPEHEWPTRPPEAMFTDVAPEVWQENRAWLAPEFWDADADLLVTCVQTWVLRSGGATILVDTGAGNGKTRPQMPSIDRLDTGFAASLAAAGVVPADVDFVVNTHLHADHIGWNTVPDNGEWAPTFPNARYLFSRAEYEFWNPDGGEGGARPVNKNAFEDSVEPIARAGQAVLFDDAYEIDANLRLELAPGHTPGSAVVSLSSAGDSAVFVGDILHSPVQVLEPGANSCFCEDPAAARATRRRVLSRAADEQALVFPAHLRGAGAAEVERSGSKFAIRTWAAFGETNR
jgi:glyoxylase-like metal-dependent hydrolase (beta-lactamase superfamily II)